jgi:hypothetical protein
MRPEQVTALVQLEEKLVDLFSAECKPDEWPDMETAQSRGDRYWHKKNALATLTLVGRIQTVLRDARTDGGAGTEGGKGEPERAADEPAESIEKEAKRLEREGARVLKLHEQRRR